MCTATGLTIGGRRDFGGGLGVNVNVGSGDDAAIMTARSSSVTCTDGGGRVRGVGVSGVWERRRSRRDGANSSNCC